MPALGTVAFIQSMRRQILSSISNKSTNGFGFSMLPRLAGLLKLIVLLNLFCRNSFLWREPYLGMPVNQFLLKLVWWDITGLSSVIFKVTDLQQNWNLCSHTVEKLCEIAWSLVMVDYVREMIAKKSGVFFKYGLLSIYSFFLYIAGEQISANCVGHWWLLLWRFSTGPSEVCIMSSKWRLFSRFAFCL